jgi:hypothetical protein
MRKYYSFRCAALGLGLLAALAGLAGCGASTADAPNGSETHFLARCEGSCGGGLECLDGLCTRSCTSDTECASLSAGAVCGNGVNGDAMCQVQCDSDAQCRAHDADWSCASVICAGPFADTSVGPLPPSSEQCPDFSGVEQPSDVLTTFVPMPAARNVLGPIVDASGVWWPNAQGAVFGLSRGSEQVIALRPAPSVPVRPLNMITDGDFLYWGESYGGDRATQPPSRLYRVPKAGGPEELLAESGELMLAPVSLDGTVIIVHDAERGELLRVSGGVAEQLTHLPALPAGVQVVGNNVYWSEERGFEQALFRAVLSGGSPEYLARIPGGFLAGDVGVLYWQSAIRAPAFQVEQFALLDLATRCHVALPRYGEHIGEPMLDDRHAYWKSEIGLAQREPNRTALLLRVDFQTGQFERILSPGLDMSANTLLAAHDASTIYVRMMNDEASLVLLNKPE